jgi:hypothetical protein
MSLAAMDIPDDPGRLPGWLERQLAGPGLAALAAELAALHGGDAGPAGSVRDLMGEDLPAVVARGLGVLPAERLRTLLMRPALLLELQELVLSAGSPYWDRLAGESAELTRMADEGGRRLAELWGGPARVVVPASDRPAVLSVAWYRRPWAVSLATAAAVLLTVYSVWPHTPPAPPGGTPGPGAGAVAAANWGWEKSDAVADGVPAAAYLGRLADGADEWFAKRPEDAAGLARRLGEFRQGCSKLVFAAHKPLAPEDRRWLVARCRTWGARLDQLRAALEEGQDVGKVRAEADATARQIAENLRLRAEAVAS